VRAERTFFFPCMEGCSCTPFFSRRRARATGGSTRKGDLARLHSASGFHGTNALAAARSSATSRKHVTIRTISPGGWFGSLCRTSNVGVLVSSELCTHVNARLLPRRWFLQLHWVPGRAHTDAQCINICTKTNSTQIHGDGNDGNVSGFGDGREPPPECPPELP
jgi:hypothetical protein